ncbi:Omp28-related outer membrane protein [Porphyromonas cangingivalis]|uniref:Outer membrane protein Omp28 n=2 Tax=Porphyromonas cangingivalis TaxID=36874 RepID=A0A1T4JTR1_PORCN|nr:Omp28-related outer membrane protein [Porphyromonas cangingivalis]SJZ33447.1 Outer membrane protein Omp28 [Porphyromonas cangingivalis]VEJ04739.1 Outer membrane protein Omp28 [Porphyromonas cangingivalis]
MKKSFYLFPLLVLLFFTHCAENHPELLVETLTISADKEHIIADDEELISFSIQSQNGRNWTNEAKIFVNGVLLDGNKFKTSEVGAFRCHAVLNEVTSNEIVFTSKIKPATLTLSADRKSILADGQDHLTFVVTDAQGKDVSALAKIRVNDVPVQGLNYKTTDVGIQNAVAFVGKEYSLPLSFVTNKVEEITLTADKPLVFVDGEDKVILMVKNAEGQDLTGESRFFVGETPMASNVYRPESVGQVSFTAIYNDNKSTSVMVTARKPIEYKLVIKPSKEILIGDNVDEVSFSCINTAENDEDLTSETTFFIDGQPLGGRVFKTDKVGTYRITARYKDHDAEPLLLVVDPHPDTIAKSLTLSADKDEIFADGEAMVTFTVKNQADRDFTSQATIQINNKPISGNTFKTTTPDIYKIVAIVGSVKSNIVTINAIKRPALLKIEANKNKIIADNKDEVILTCINTADKDKDVTGEATFFVDGKAISGNKFKTNKVGDYRITARFDGSESSPVLIVAEPHPDTIVKELTITANKRSFVANNKEVVTFRAKNQANKDFTSEATFYINDKPISGNTFKTSVADAYKVYAKVGDKQSNVLTLQATPRPASLRLQLDKRSILADGAQKVRFTVQDANDRDISSKATFMVNGQRINAREYSTDVPGTYKVVAMYEEEHSEEETFTAHRPERITIEMDKQELTLGTDRALFTVRNSAQSHITDASQIFINGQAIPSRYHTPDRVGTFRAYAIYNGNKSAEISFHVKEAVVQNLLVKADKSVIVSDGADFAILRCTDSSRGGRDVTEEAEFFADGQRLQSNILKTQKVGNISITAKLKNQTSAPLQLKGQTTLSAVPKLYVEEFTGTWCPYCPRAIHMVDEASKNPQVIAVAFHTGANSKGHPRYDPFSSSATLIVGNVLGVRGYPSLVANRDRNQHIQAYGNPVGITSRIPSDTSVGIAIQTTLSGHHLSATVNVRSSETREAAHWVAIITEDKLIADQRNGTGRYPHIGKNFSHDHVYRKSYGDVRDGTEFSLPKDQTQHLTFSLNLDNKLVPSNCKLVILVMDKDRKVLNAQVVKLGDSISY